jgi:hypothetical protein
VCNSLSFLACFERNESGWNITVRVGVGGEAGLLCVRCILFLFYFYFCKFGMSNVGILVPLTPSNSSPLQFHWHTNVLFTSAPTPRLGNSLEWKLIIDTQPPTVHAVTRPINSARSMQSHSNFNFGGFHLQGSHLITFKEKRFKRRNGYNNRFILNSKGIVICTRVSYAKLHQTLFQLTIHRSAFAYASILAEKCLLTNCWP